MISAAVNGPDSSVGRVLVVSHDGNTVQSLTQAMQELALYPEVCHEVPSAIRLLNSRKFEGVMIDLSLGEAAKTILEGVRASRANRSSIIFTISRSHEGSAEALRGGSSFVLEQPLSADAISRTLRAAYGLIVRERRRYFRCLVAVQAVVRKTGCGDIQCRTINISEGGMALLTAASLEPGCETTVLFRLPNHHFQFALEAFVCWSDSQGRAGFRFAAPPGKWESELQEWLSERLEESLPESVAEKFRREMIS